MQYQVAAQRSSMSRPRGVLAVGRRTRRPGRRVPVGTSHAVPLGGQTTLCGVDVDELASFAELDFELPSRLHKCDGCRRALAQVL